MTNVQAHGVLLRCNQCGRVWPAPTASDQLAGLVVVARDSTAARISAAAEGWTYERKSRQGLDYCPDCTNDKEEG